MTVYSLFEPPAGSDRRAVLVPDRFSWLAFLLPPVFMLLHRLWLALLVYAVAVVGLVLLGLWLGEGATTALYFLFALLLGFEAPNLRRRKLAREKFGESGAVIASDGTLADLTAQSFAGRA